MKEDTPRKFHLREFKAISYAISSYEDLNMLIKHIAEGITRTFKVKGCSIMLFDDREKQLFHVASYGISEAYLNKGPVFADEKHSALSRGEPVFIQDMQNDPRIQYPDAAAKENLTAMLSIPIKCRNAVLGVIRIYHNDPIVFHEDDVDSLGVMAQHMGLVIENNGLKNFLDEVKMAIQNLPLRMIEGITA
jgi:signal transduction protein with GAF and PtsI domain